MPSQVPAQVGPARKQGMRAERLVRRQGSSCRLSKGSSALPLSVKRVLMSISPSWLVRLRSFLAKGSSLPYTMLASRKEVRALIWLRMVILLSVQAGQERKNGMQSLWFLMRGSLGGICGTEEDQASSPRQGQWAGVALSLSTFLKALISPGKQPAAQDQRGRPRHQNRASQDFRLPQTTGRLLKAHKGSLSEVPPAECL